MIYTVICDSMKTMQLYKQLLQLIHVNIVAEDNAEFRVSVDLKHKDAIVDYHNKNRIGVLRGI